MKNYWTERFSIHLKGFVRIFFKSAITLLLIFLILISLIYFPPVQSFITKKAEGKLCEYLETKVEIGGIHLNFAANLIIDNLIIQNQEGDDLLKSESINLEISIIKLLSKEIHFRHIELQDMHAYLYIDTENSSTNIDFIIDKFKQEKKPPEKKKPAWKIFADNITIEQSSFLLHIEKSLKLFVTAGNLSMQSKNMDFENLEFDIDKISVEESFISLDLLKDSLKEDAPVKVSASSRKELKTNIIAQVKILETADIGFSMKYGDEFILDTELKSNKIENTYFNLQEKKISIDELSMDDGFCNIVLNSKYNTDSISNSESRFLEKIVWEIKTNNTELNQFQFSFDNNFYPDTASIFDANHFAIKEAELSIEDAVMASRLMNARINNLHFSEKNGFVLEKFGATLAFSGEQLICDSLIFDLPESKIRGSVKLKNDPIDNFPDQLSLIDFDLLLNELDIKTSDLSSLISGEILNKYNVSNIKSANHIYGNMNHFKIENFFMNMDDEIYGKLTGSIKNLLSPDKLCLDLIADEFHISLGKAARIIPLLDNYTQYFPPEIIINSVVNGCRNNISTNTIVESIYGNIEIKAEYNKDAENSNDSLVVRSDFKKFELGSVLENENLGIINFFNVTSITGLEKEEYNISTSGIVEDAIINNYQLAGIHYKANYYNEEGNVEIESYDSSIDFSISNQFLIQDSTIFLTTEANLKNADLFKLGISSDTFQLQGDINFENVIRKNFFSGEFKFTDVELNTQENLVLGEINIDFLKDRDSSYFELKSDILSGVLHSNIPIGDIQSRLTDFYKPYFIKFDSAVDIEYNGILDFKFSFHKPNNNLVKLYPGLEELHFTEISGYLNESTKTSFIKIGAPRISYENVTIDSVNLEINGDSEKLSYDIEMLDLSYNNYHLKRIFLGGNSKEGRVNNVILLRDTANVEFYKIGYIIDQTADNEIVFNIDPENLILNYKNWLVNDTSKIYLRNNELNGNLNISYGNQSLYIYVYNQLYDFKIKNFQLGNLENLFEAYRPGFKMIGLVDFNLDMKLDSLNPLVNMDLQVKDLNVNGTQLGNIEAQMSNDEARKISGELTLQNQSNRIKLETTYEVRQKNQPLKAKMEIDLNDLQDFQSFANELIKDPKGELKGNIAIAGDFKKIKTEGTLAFHDVSFFSTTLSSNYFLQDEAIDIKNDQLLLKEFILRDEQNNQFVIDGSIHSPQFMSFDLNLRLNADNFTVFNKPIEESPNFYGNLIISNDVLITGTYSAPDISMSLSFDAGTNLTYVLPPKEIDVISSDGIVEFIGTNQLDSVQELNIESILKDTILTKYKGLNLKSEIIIDKNAVFKIEIDPLSGDYITTNGNGKLTLIKDRDTEPMVSGSYEIEDGLYEVSFYGLVKKTFKFEKGSSLVWTGNPYNPLLNLDASYTVRTSSTGLVSNEIYGLSDEEKAMYRKPLPYLVGINIGGKIQDPKLGFNIDLPDEDKSGFPLVETKLNRLNEPGYESELTKQVFGLLTLGSFIPEASGADGGTYGTALATTAAANSLNGILTNELNKLTGRYIKGADLEIGMQTYSELYGSQQSMQTTMDIRFSKKLFNERVTLEAKSSFDLYNESPINQGAYDYSNVHSDFAIIYDLREAGDYKLKAFDKSSYDIIYKDIRSSGLALIFIKEFDNYSREKKSRKESQKSKSK